MLAHSRSSAVCADINWTIERQIATRTWGRIRRLRVEATPERVMVVGSTPSYYLKQLALAAISESLASMSIYPVLDVDIQVMSEATTPSAENLDQWPSRRDR